MTKPAREARARAHRPYVTSLSWAIVITAALLTGCGGDGKSPETPPPPDGGALDAQVLQLAKTTRGLTGDPATRRNAQQIVPATDPLVKLGMLLFFSQTLSAGYDVSCGTCHHPDFAGSDGLSLSVGPVPKNAAVVGPGREIDPGRDLDPSADGGPNMHRNSMTTLNAGLFDRALMFDGRVFVLDEETVSGGHGQRIRTPESGQSADISPLDGLMQFTMKGPIVNDNEMRAFLYSDLATPAEYREHLMKRLHGTEDTLYNTKPDAAANWLALFRAAFDSSAENADEVITVLNTQRALAAYINSKVFVDTPWRRFLEGNDAAISTAAKRGAILFLNSKEAGGLGCSACHAGDRFSDEAFHNVGFPQFGRGFGRSERNDLGRWLSTRAAADAQAFRTPMLLNVGRTAPYGHTGAFGTLRELLKYHADPASEVDNFDFTLRQLEQFSSGAVQYPEAEHNTRAALARENFLVAQTLLPARTLSDDQLDQLVAFLETLTDSCVANPACISQWAPTEADDPDGHTLLRNTSEGNPGPIDAEYPDQQLAPVALDFPALPARATFADVAGCSSTPGTAFNSGQSSFVQRSEDGFGFVDHHGYSQDTWFSPQQSTLEVAMMGGGVTAGYLDDDCWPDLVFTGGDDSGMRFYRNEAGTGFSPLNLLAGTPEREFSGAAFADLNGDYRRELILGNVRAGSVPIYGSIGAGQFGILGELPMIRPTFGISFAPLDNTGYPYLYLSHWSGGTGTNGGSPALWRSDGAFLSPWDKQGRTTSSQVDQRFNFTPKFADFTGDGRIDLVIASDFSTSTLLRNVPDGTTEGWHFRNETTTSPITDENGMGSALLDIDNDGNLEWFVTSVLDPADVPAGNWGKSGNRLYRNASTSERIAFTDITTQAGVRDGYWGWGACAADFNNDGFIDLFHVNGFGYIPASLAADEPGLSLRQLYNANTAHFQGKPSRLFINNANGTFSDQAAGWSIDVPSEGRGVTCLDHDRDGDMDIAVFDHSSRLQFFENRGGAGADRRFIGIRLVGAAPNTDAIGARVYVTADVGQRGVQTQMRLAEANSNFNSQNLPDLHFGLGGASVVSKIQVAWPGGAQLTCTNVPVNRFLVLDQRLGEAACPGAPGE